MMICRPMTTTIEGNVFEVVISRKPPSACGGTAGPFADAHDDQRLAQALK
jgi:hypothetical protein